MFMVMGLRLKKGVWLSNLIRKAPEPRGSVPYGLVLLDPTDAALKRLAAPLYAEAAQRAEEIAAATAARSRELVEAGYHAQVHTNADAFPLFLIGIDQAADRSPSTRRLFSSASRKYGSARESLPCSRSRRPIW